MVSGEEHKHGGVDRDSKNGNGLPSTAAVDSGPVQAYAKLEGEEFCYYIRTLQVTLGRKASSAEKVDIPLGATKAVSRQHARLFYNFTTQRFEMMVLGKNGAFVDDQFVERGVTVPLNNRTRIQIGEILFSFLLPRIDADEPAEGSSNAFDQKSAGSGPLSPPTTRGEAQAVDASQPGSPAPDGEGEGRDAKPNYSYASLIAQAINSTANKKLTLNGIYNYITTHYPYYQMAQNGWQNSIRHNLSLNKAFIKVPRGDNEPGKGAFWAIDPKFEGQFSNGIYKKQKRTNYKTASPSDKERASSAIAPEESEQTEKIVKKRALTRKPDAAATNQVDSKSLSTATIAVSTQHADKPDKLPHKTSPIMQQKPVITAQAQLQSQLQAQLQAQLRQHLLSQGPQSLTVQPLTPQQIQAITARLPINASSVTPLPMPMNGQSIETVDASQTSKTNDRK
ncbi:hypothetical protein BZG36_04625 [Bifiguratus adelaidae]|uniref:Fork-head domain-containing protein n=1 Tax=Bifiguratus adelaidae TaxID=1938954 RepID=A0A261XX81_9FUNG|nr:hypothetical protein BZG36_04625 [Bifiguratus adelaidae]